MDKKRDAKDNIPFLEFINVEFTLTLVGKSWSDFLLLCHRYLTLSKIIVFYLLI